MKVSAWHETGGGSGSCRESSARGIGQLDYPLLSQVRVEVLKLFRFGLVRIPGVRLSEGKESKSKGQGEQKKQLKGVHAFMGWDWTLRIRNLPDTYIPVKLIKSLTINQGISARGIVLEEVHSADLGCGGNGRSEVRLLPVDGPVQAFQSDRRNGREIQVAQADGGGLHDDVGHAPAEGQSVHV